MLAGLSGFVMVFFMPAILQLVSTRVCLARWGERGRRAPSTSPLSGAAIAYAVLLVGGAAFAFSVWRIVLSLVSAPSPPPSPPNATAA